MPISRASLSSSFTLRWPSAVIKLCVVIFCAASAAGADARQPCPPLEINAICAPAGTATVTLRAGADAPPDLSYLVSLPDEGIGAISLAPGGSLNLDLPAPDARQVTVTVVGLEPAGSSLSACCLSNQRVHLPASCAPAAPDQSAALALPADDPVGDMSMDLTLAPGCSRQKAAPVCQGVLTVSGTGPEQVQVTLSAALGRRLQAEGADCSAFAKGQALCLLQVGRPLSFDLALSPDARPAKATLCAELGIGSDAVSRTLALQEALARAGYRPGKVDGDFGPATQAALAAFVADAGLPPLAGNIPPKVLSLLGIGDFSDALPDNNRACAVALVPALPLTCDAATTRASGDTCACRFKGMSRVSAQACACPKGQKLGAKGCRNPGVGGTETADTGTPTGTDDPAGTGPACDPATTVLRKGECQCRTAEMRRVSQTRCEAVDIRLCPDGSPEVPGIPCPPAGPACLRFNAAGECCDDLGPGDASCR